MQFSSSATLLLATAAATAPSMASAESEPLPVLPQTCAIAYDDPHLTTFDGHNYDCQGNGDFILSKSFDSDFELQGRFYKEDWPSGLVGTTTEAAVLRTGVAGEPKVEASYDRQCNLNYYINNQLVADLEDTLDTTNAKVSFYKSGKERYFYFEDSGVSLHLTLRLNHVFGCFLNVKLCLPDSIKSQNLVGLMGSPDGNTSNDYMDRQGTDLEKVGKIFWGQIHDYCTQTWCIGSNSDSLFETPGDASLCNAPYDDKCEKEVEKAPKEVKDKCGDDLACIIDSIVSGDSDTGTETKNDERDLQGKEEIESCDEVLKMETRVCELPNMAEDFSVVALEDAHIGAHSMYKGLAIGGTLYDSSPTESGTIDKTVSYIKSLDDNNRFNFNKPKELGSSCVADSMADRLAYLARHAEPLNDGHYVVKVYSVGGTYSLEDFRKEGQGEDNGMTLAIFNTKEDIVITKGHKTGRQFGPTIIAPFAKVTVMKSAGFVDGSIYAKTLYAQDGQLQLHGDTYLGPITCGDGITKRTPEITPEKKETQAPSNTGSCKAAWAQCGGNGYTGVTCCVEGHTCVKDSDWWSACKPTPEKKTPGSGGSCKKEWEQCGGNGYNGETCCVQGTECVEDSEWWSACKPEVPNKPPKAATPAPSASTPAPSQSTPQPSVSTPAPSQSTPLPSASTPSPSQSTPAPTEAPVESCPEKMPEFGSECNFAASLKCAYGKETCCDGSEHDSVVMECGGGIVHGFHTDACLAIKCEEAASTPAPSQSTPQPSVSTPAPSQSTPAPSQSTPQPSVSTPAPSQSTPAPSQSTPQPSISARAPSKSTPVPTEGEKPKSPPVESCPEKMPEFGSECNFAASLSCAYGKETCCDGSEHDSVVMECGGGIVHGFHTDACLAINCEEPVSTPVPSQSTPAPSQSTPQPSVSTPAPSQSTPQPSASTPAPSQSTPQPSVSTPAPSQSTPQPSVSTPAPSQSTPAPTAEEKPKSPPVESCPEKMPEFGSECNFAGNLKCAYGKETCCDGSEHDSVVMECGDGIVQGFHTDACLAIKCEEPPVACTLDTKKCEDGTVVGRSGPNCEFVCPEPPKPETPKNAPPGGKGSGSGDPHFKTWLGDKFDYHGECDLVLVDNPSFADGLGLKVHIRTTRIKYFSFIEKVALQIGTDVLEFDNDVENFLINGKKVEENRHHHKTMLGPYQIRRDPRAISIRLKDGTGLHQKTGAAKIDLVHRKNGFPAVIVDAGHSDIFKGSLGLLGEWGTGRTLARDGKTVIPVSQYEATEFALEWQVRDNEPMLFKDSRFPQFPNVCTPPAKMPENRLGAARRKQEAEEACAHWKEDKQDCVFDVIASGDILVAQEGHFSASH